MTPKSGFLIDPPGEFAPIEAWRKHLQELIEENAIDPHPALAAAIKVAEDRIAEKR